MPTRLCIVCGEQKPASEFCRHRKKRDPLTGRCWPCENKRNVSKGPSICPARRAAELAARRAIYAPDRPSRQHVLTTTTCPTCKEPAGSPCRGTRRERVALHRDRWLLATVA